MEMLLVILYKCILMGIVRESNRVDFFLLVLRSFVQRTRATNDLRAKIYQFKWDTISLDKNFRASTRKPLFTKRNRFVFVTCFIHLFSLVYGRARKTNQLAASKYLQECGGWNLVHARKCSCAQRQESTHARG